MIPRIAFPRRTPEQILEHKIWSAEYDCFAAMRKHFRNSEDHGIGSEFWVENRGTLQLRVQCHCGWDWAADR